MLDVHLICSPRRKRKLHLACPQELMKNQKCNTIYLLIGGGGGGGGGGGRRAVCTCVSHREEMITSNGNEKIKHAHVLPREPSI